MSPRQSGEVSGGEELRSSLSGEVVLGEELGAGAFGRVYKGCWNGQQVAVKVLHTACGPKSREIHSFRREVSVLSQLRHPHIVHLLAASTSPPDICIVEEYAEGGSLYNRLHGRRRGARGEDGRQRATQSGGPLPLKQLLEVAIDVAGAMAYLHPRVVHRDLKSQNVLLDGEGRAKVCDFGIAKFKDRTFVSTANGHAGTPAYMAPELFDGSFRISEKVDVYAFGVLLWECYTGELPWSGHEHMQIIYAVGVQKLRPAIPTSCPAPLGSLITSCWGTAPEDRPPFPLVLERLQTMHKELLVVEGTPPLPPQKLVEGGPGQGVEN